MHFTNMNNKTERERKRERKRERLFERPVVLSESSGKSRNMKR